MAAVSTLLTRRRPVSAQALPPARALTYAAHWRHERAGGGSTMLWMVMMAQAVAGDAGYDQVRAWAQRDEASLAPAAYTEMLDSMSEVGGAAFTRCMPTPAPETLAAFTVVLQLDAQGKVVRTWREGDAAVARCVDAGFAGKTLFVPPQAPFYAAFEFQVQP